MNISNYKKKTKNLLLDKAYKAYKKLDKDSINTIAQNTKILVEKSNIPNKTKSTLKPSNPVPPRLYGLPKVHKPNISLRPIVSAIHSPTYNSSRFLTQTLQPLTGKSESHITNSTDFIKKDLFKKDSKNPTTSHKLACKFRRRIPFHTSSNKRQHNKDFT